MDELTEGSVTSWLGLFRAGDEQAAAELWNRYFSRLVQTARAKLGGTATPAADAEDVALSAFHTIYQAARQNRMPQMTDRDSFWKSLLVIATGKVIDARRRATSQKRSTPGQPADVPSTLALETVVSREPDPHLALMVEETFLRMLHCLDDAELKEIVLLKMDGYTHAEIANRLDCSERTIKRRLTIIRRIWEQAELHRAT
jgi:RNA polymerase sigma factor (sigma-70 family)